MRAYANHNSVKNFFFNHFKLEIKDKHPIKISVNNQKKFLKEYKKRILSLEGTKGKCSVFNSNWYGEDYYSYKESKYKRCFSCGEYNFKLFFNENDIFSIKFRSYVRQVYQFLQFEKLVHIVHKNHVREKLRWYKKKTIKRLQEAAMLGKIKALAKEKKFNYVLDEYSTKTKWIVQMDKQQSVEINILNKNLHEMVRKLETFTNALSTLRETGIAFRTKQGKYGQHNWKSYKDL